MLGLRERTNVAAFHKKTKTYGSWRNRFLWLVCATSAARKNTPVSAEGVIVAIQGGLTDTRLVEPASFADLAEIYMVRVDRWAMGDGRHMLPVKVEIRRAIGKVVGETVKVLLKQRVRA